ncbi:MAG: sugar phosphate isomerase/epimerase [Spirochaetaceae bacterium]|nr:sugar phosphate isomerase/epimerase [Spirochaetaceae bacterium]
MYLTGFADEAADSLEGQIKATRALGWENIEARSINGKNIHDIPEEEFGKTLCALEEAGIHINCFGSTLANWGTPVDGPFEDTIATVERAISRMKRCKTRLIRIMSYAVLCDKEGRALDDQKEEERFRRLREIVRRFTDEGITPVHENCHTYGGMGIAHAKRLLENVPGLKLVFDTGNPPLTPDFEKPFPYPVQDSWQFYTSLRPHIAYVHIKDGFLRPAERGRPAEEVYTFPGEGRGCVEQIVKDLFATGYDGGFSMEPHMAVVFHDAAVQSAAEKRLSNYTEYGRRFMKILAAVRAPAAK